MLYTEAIMGLKGNAKDFQKYTALLEKYKNAEGLVINDLFKDKVRNGNIIADMTEIDIKHIYPLLNYRYYEELWKGQKIIWLHSVEITITID